MDKTKRSQPCPFLQYFPRKEGNHGAGGCGRGSWAHLVVCDRSHIPRSCSVTHLGPTLSHARVLQCHTPCPLWKQQGKEGSRPSVSLQPLLPFIATLSSSPCLRRREYSSAQGKSAAALKMAIMDIISGQVAGILGYQ